MSKLTELNGTTNDAKMQIDLQLPFTISASIRGTAPMLFHRWSNEDVAEKSAAKKNSKVKKTDNLEAYISRNEDKLICLPSEYIRMALINSSKYDQHPQKPRASAYELFKAGILCTPELCVLNGGVSDWDYEDKRRVVIQRAAITRTRPAFKEGWHCDIEITSLLPDLIDHDFLYKALVRAGMLIGVADFRPTYGRFAVTRFELKQIEE